MYVLAGASESGCSFFPGVTTMGISSKSTSSAGGGGTDCAITALPKKKIETIIVMSIFFSILFSLSLCRVILIFSVYKDKKATPILSGRLFIAFRRFSHHSITM